MTHSDASRPPPVHHVTMDEVREQVRAQFDEYEARVSSEQRRDKLLALLAGRAVWGWGSFFFNRLTMVTAEQGDDGSALPVLAIQAMGAPIIVQITVDELADLGPCPNL